MEFHHVSVLLEECIEALKIRPGGVYVDGTLGGAGHSFEIAKRLQEGGRLIGIDQDEEAIMAARERLLPFLDKVTLVKSNFAQTKEVLQQLGVEGIDGCLLDIGVSSHQLDEGRRGFSYMQDAPLDMRMDMESPLSAREVVNTYTEDTLCSVISRFGEERWAKRIAQFIVQERQKKPLETTFELVEVIKKAVPKGARRDGPHPAKRTFQAIRIEVNQELDVLQRAVMDLTDTLQTGGRLCIITFHSLEDRIVKNAFRQLENPCTCPPQFPVCMCGKKPVGKAVTRKPILPSETELLENPRARSAKLRVFEKH